MFSQRNHKQSSYCEHLWLKHDIKCFRIARKYFAKTHFLFLKNYLHFLFVLSHKFVVQFLCFFAVFSPDFIEHVIQSKFHWFLSHILINKKIFQKNSTYTINALSCTVQSLKILSLSQTLFFFCSDHLLDNMNK